MDSPLDSNLNPQARERFSKLLVESIVESITFGEVVLHFIELNSLVKREEIAEKPELLAREFEDLFGDSAKIIEERIIRKLYLKIGIKYDDKEGYTFPEYIKKAYKEFFKA